MKRYRYIGFLVMILYLGCQSSVRVENFPGDTSDEKISDDSSNEQLSSDSSNDDSSSEEQSTEPDGYTVSSKTGLWWQIVVLEDTMTWEEAVSYCENLELGGHTDWVLPELQHYIDMLGNCKEGNLSMPSCNYCADSEECSSLEGLNENGDFWTSREYVLSDKTAWAVTPLYGTLVYYPKIYQTARARCVRGDLTQTNIDICFPNPCNEERVCNSEDRSCSCSSPYMTEDCKYCLFGNHISHYPDCPAPSYSVDEKTGLWWMYFAPTGVLTFEQSVAYCENFELDGYKGWRLPTLEEFVDILGNCNSENLEELEKCDPCASSPRCKKLMEIAEGINWTTTKLKREDDSYDDSDVYFDEYFTVNPETGEISTYNLNPRKHRCVRDPS